MIHPRIMSVEVEYGEYPNLAVIPGSFFIEHLPMRQVMRAYAEKHMKDTQKIFPFSAFLANQARCYMDVMMDRRLVGTELASAGIGGPYDIGQIEYAAPECIAPLQAVLHEKAGDRILEAVANEFNKTHPEYCGSVTFLKNNRDARGAIFGCHRNFLLYAGVSPRHCAQVLAPLFVTAHRWMGTGMPIAAAENRCDYWLSERAPAVQYFLGVSVPEGKPPLILERNEEPHADRNRYQRLQVVGFDSLMSECSSLRLFTVIDICLRMIEDRFSFSWMPREERESAFEIEFIALKNSILSYETLGAPVIFRGRTVHPEDITREFLLENIWNYERRGGLVTSEEKSVLDEIDKILGILKKARLGEIEYVLMPYGVDWAAKRVLMNQDMRRLSYSWDSAPRRILPFRHRISGVKTKKEQEVLTRLWEMHLQYHDVNRRRGLYYLCERQGLVPRCVSEEDIARAAMHPPSETRAKLRDNEFARIEAAGGHLTSFERDHWEIVRSSSGDAFFPSPYNTAALNGDAKIIV